MGFSGSVNGTTKTQVFWILVFANVNGPSVICQSQKSMPGGVKLYRAARCHKKKMLACFKYKESV